MKPLVLPANQPADRFYAGGRQIAAFRGVAATGSHVPEDWVGSTTPVFGAAPVGMTVLNDGRLLRDAIAADPVAWLGAAHVEAFGDDPALLVKLLDAGQRLPVHAHPDRPFAAQHLGLGHGKTEAWIILEGATMHLGFTRDVTSQELAGWVAGQDTDAMLDAMHVLPVSPGDTVFVPAGLPHAIGDGAFVVELQEPTDLSILLEWHGFAIDGAAAGHLGLGFDVALGAVDRRGWSAADVAALRTPADASGGGLLPEAAAFFRAERRQGRAVLEPGFAVLVVVAGAGELVTGENGHRVALQRGTTILLPAAAGPVHLDGDADILVCRPPLP